MLGAPAGRPRSPALATIAAVGLLCSLAPRAHAVEAFDGRLQLHGFGEVQVRTLSNNFQEDLDLAQWYNVLNLEFEADVAPDGWGPTDLIEAFVRVEARYDCVWTRGCGMLQSENAYGDRAQKVPQRFRDARDDDYSGVIPPTPPGTFAVSRTPNSDQFGRTTDAVLRNSRRNVQPFQPRTQIETDITTGTPVPAFPTSPVFDPVRAVLGEDFFVHEPFPREGIAGFDTLFAQRGADNILGTSDDPALYTFGRILDVRHPYSWALANFKGPPGGSGTQLIGPWRPANKIHANALLIDRANPFRGGFAVMTGGYRGEDPLDPRLAELKEALEALGNTTAVPALTTARADDVTMDSFAGDFSGVIPCVSPTTLEAEQVRIGLAPQPNCVPNLVALETGMPSFATRDQELANVRVAFDTGPFGGGRLETRAGGSGELPFRPAPDLSNLTPVSQNRQRLQAQGLYLPSQGLQNALASGEFDTLGFNFDQLERSFNRGQAQQQTGELKEAYLDIEWLDSRLWTRIGLQNIVWGKTELFRTTDQFNPQDLALASLPSLEESRIALWAFRAVYSLYDVGPLEDVRAEFAFNFDEFKPADLGAAGEPFTPDLVGGLTTGIFFHGVTGVGVAGIDRPPNPWDNINGLEIGGRLEWRWDRFSFALTDFYGYNDFPYIDRIWTYDRTVSPSTGRPMVGGLDANQADPCQMPVLDRNDDGIIDTTPDPFIPGSPNLSIIDSKNPISYTPLGIGGDQSCLKGGGAAGFRNADPWFGGQQNALENHYANQQIFAWICETTIGIGAVLDAGSCAWNIFGSSAPLRRDFLPVPFGEMISTVSSGDPDVRIRNFLGVVNANQRPSFPNLTATPLASTNRDPGPVNPNCPTDPDAYSPFVECARWDGIITATSTLVNRSPDLPTTSTIFISGELLTQVNGFRATDGTGPLPPGPIVDGMPTGRVTSTCTQGTPVVPRPFPNFFGTVGIFSNDVLVRARFPDLEPSLPGICPPATMQHDAQDLLTLDSTLTNFQKALLGCAAFFGTRCDSSVPIDVYTENSVSSSVAQLNAQINVAFQEGGGIDFLNTDASALQQSWPGREGTAPMGAEADGVIFWTTFGQKRQPGTADVVDPSGIYEQGREFGPHCSRPDGKGGLIVLPGCRGIESIFVTRDPTTEAVLSVQIAFEDGYRPSVDGCLVGGVVDATAPLDVVGSLGANSETGDPGVAVTLVANSNGYTPDPGELRQCHTSSTHKFGNFTTFSTEVAGSNWLWHPVAGCLSEDRAGKVKQFGANNPVNVDEDAFVENAQGQLVPAVFGDCGTILRNGVPINRGFLNRFQDFNQDGILDIEQEFLGTLVRADCDLVVAGTCEQPFATAQLFQNELAAVSWNFLSFLVLTSCSQDNQGQGNISEKQECFNPAFPLLADKCSFNAPHLCSNVKGFLSVAGATRSDLRAGGNGRFGRATFIWHSGGEIALRYDKRNVLGFSMDFAEDVTKSNWGVEFSWIEGLPFTDNNSPTNVSTSDVVNLTVSVDRPTFVNFLNANRTIFFNSQWFFQYVNDYHGGYTSNGPWNVLFTFAAFTGYFQDRLLPTFVSVFDVQSQSGGFLPNVAYRFTEAFSATIGVNIFFGHTERVRMPLNEIAPVSNRAPLPNNESIAYTDGVDNVLSVIRKRDEIYLRLRWTF